MRLQKLQKFLKENNIDYTYSSDKYSNNEFGTIHIKNSETGFYSLSEVTGNRGNTPSGIMAFYEDLKTGRKEKYILSSQTEIINRIETELKK